MSKALQPTAKYGRKETGPKALPTPTAPKHNASVRGDARMPVIGNITACGDSASVENQTTFKSIGQLARELAEKQGAKL
jgi:hypothetical protein